MFQDVRVRFVLRAVIVAAAAGFAAAAPFFADNPAVVIPGAVLVALTGYLGLGAAVPQIEPSIGNKMEDDGSDHPR